MSKGNGVSIGGDRDIAVERELPCKLTEAELLERGESQAEAELKIETLKTERRETNRLINVQVDLRNKLAHTVDSGEEMRKVLCKWIADFDHNVWNLVRQDTGDQVEQRTMSAADRQAGLPFPPVTDEPIAEAVEVVGAVDGGEIEVDGDTEVLSGGKGKASKKKRGAKPSGKVKGKAKGKSRRAYA